MIYASMRDCVSATHLQSLLAGLASVFQAASLTQRLLSPTSRGQSSRRVFPRHAFSPGHRRTGEGCWRGRLGCPEAALLRRATQLPIRCCQGRFGTMPHVAAYGILLVQCLFFFLGGRSGSAAITMR